MDIVISSMIYVVLKPYEVISRLERFNVNAIELSYDNIVYLVRKGFNEDEILKEFADAIKSSGIRVLAGHLPYGEVLNRAVNLDEQETVVRYLEKWIKFYSSIGSKVVAIHIPFNNPSIYENSIDYLLRIKSSALNFFRALEKLLSEYGVRLAIENRLERGVYGYLPQDILAIIREINSENIGMCMDIGHAFINGLNLSDFYKVYKDYIYLIHAHDNDGIRDLHLPPFTGRIDWRRLLEELRASYRGVIVFEVACHRNTADECDNTLELLLAIMNKFL